METTILLRKAHVSGVSTITPIKPPDTILELFILIRIVKRPKVNELTPGTSSLRTNVDLVRIDKIGCCMRDRALTLG